MNAVTILGTIGTIVAILGITFHLQGQSVVGPASSFMYANPEWITYGIQISFVGIVIIVIAIIVKIIKK
jgi:hypothetical protein